MVIQKYIVEKSDESNLPKHFWFGKKYKVYPRLHVDTSSWIKIVPEPEEKSPSRKRRSFKKLVRSVMMSQRLSKSCEGRIKGRTLAKCDLPDDMQQKVADLLRWEVKNDVKITVTDENDDLIEDEVTKEPSTEETKKSDTTVVPVQHNPYLGFLDAVSEEKDEDRDQLGLLGGLQSWLGFAGSLGGTEMTALANVAGENSNLR